MIEYLGLLYEQARDDMEQAPPDQLLVAQARARQLKKLIADITTEPKFTPKE